MTFTFGKRQAPRGRPPREAPADQHDLPGVLGRIARTGQSDDQAPGVVLRVKKGEK